MIAAGDMTVTSTATESSCHIASYLLPVKAAVRKAERLVEGKSVRVQVVVRRAW